MQFKNAVFKFQVYVQCVYFMCIYQLTLHVLYVSKTQIRSSLYLLMA